MWLQVYDCIGASASRRRSLLAAALLLEWTVTTPTAAAAQAQSSVVRIVQEQAPEALQGAGFAVTSAAAAVTGSGPSIAAVEVVDYETGEVFQDGVAPVILLAGEQAMTLRLPLPSGRFDEPGWTAVDNVDGDISDRCRAKFLNSTEDFLDVTSPGKPLVWRCASCGLCARGPSLPSVHCDTVLQ